MKSTPLANTLLVAASLLLALAVLELGLRFLERAHAIDLTVNCLETSGASLHTLIHPYLGYTQVIDSAPDQPYTNTARPYLPRETACVVGVFGGSVASNMAMGVRASANFETVLQRLTTRTVKVLNFATGAYKQPQSLLSLAYLAAIGQKLDYVILIDGYNEAYFPALNVAGGLPVNYPAASILAPLVALTGKGPRNALFIQAYADMVGKIRLRDSLCSLPVLRWTSLGKAGVKAAAYVLNSRIDSLYRDLHKFRDVDLKDSIYHIPPPAGDDAVREGAALWANGAVSMQALASAMGARMFHFIQPNQYVSGHRFSEHEAAIAFVRDRAVHEQVRTGYARILAEADRLRATGHDVRSLLGLFDDIPEEVYCDNCCHYNVKGSDVLQDTVARTVAAAINAAPDPTR